MSNGLRMTTEAFEAHQARVKKPQSPNPPLVAPLTAEHGDGGARPSKYKNVKYELDGIVFDSKREMKRWCVLQQLEAAGEIQNLQRQVRYELIPPQYENGKCVERAVNYVADFNYWQGGAEVVEDAKGYVTPMYVLKRKLMRHVHGIVVIES